MMLTDEEIDALWPEITLPQKVARREILRKGIAANNAKVLADLKPVGFLDQFNCFYTFRHPEMRTREMFSSETVSALIQDRDALAARVKELEAWLEGDATCPCCGQSVECLDGCTYATDAPYDHDKMQEVRNVLKATS